MNSYEMYIQLDPALEYIIEEISIYLTRDYHITATYQDIIEKETKATYIELLAKQDLNGFMSFAQEILAKEQKRMQAFYNMDNEKISYE